MHHPVRLRPVGSAAVLVEVDGIAQALDLARFLRAARLAADEVVPGATTVLVDGVSGPDAVRAVLEGWEPAGDPGASAEVEVPVTYDGADLDDVAERWGTDRAGVVDRHAGTAFVAAFCGFAPGFAYLSGLAEDLAVPRLASPRTRVPAGAVALAGSWCGVYPTASPGGWRILGRTEVRLWDAAREQPALLGPGTRVRFVPA